MCLTSDNDCETAKTLFTAIESKFGKNSLPWNNCVGRNVENNNIMIGKHNSKVSNTLKKNPSIFIGGCPCHLAHLTTSHAHDSFLEVLRVNTENLCIIFTTGLTKVLKGKVIFLSTLNFVTKSINLYYSMYLHAGFL